MYTELLDRAGAYGEPMRVHRCPVVLNGDVDEGYVEVYYTLPDGKRVMYYQGVDGEYADESARMLAARVPESVAGVTR